MNTIKRIPRPLGITEQGKLYYNTKDNDAYNNIKAIMIKHYVGNNFSYLGQYMNVENYSRLTGINEIGIKKGIVTYGVNMSQLYEDMSGGESMRAILAISLGMALEDRTHALQQHNILLQQQGQNYVPFLSGEINQVLKTMQGSTSNLMAMAKLLGAGTQGSQPEAPTARQNGDTITVDQAVMAFKESKVTPLLQDPSHQEHLFDKYSLDDMPIIDARIQVGVDTSREGLGLNKITDIDLDKVEILEDKVTKHQNRRAKMLGKDLEDI